jgi:hypothetical protein
MEFSFDAIIVITYRMVPDEACEPRGRTKTTMELPLRQMMEGIYNVST